MDLKTLLQQVSTGKCSVDQALEQINTAFTLELQEGLCLDTGRQMRTRIPEVIFGIGKSKDQLRKAVQGLIEQKKPVLVTKLDPKQGSDLQTAFNKGYFNPQAGIFSLETGIKLAPPWPKDGDPLILSAGASDLFVALEAFATAQFLGKSPGLISDVGVAGLNRLLPHLQACRQARILIVIAGMEGALPSVVAGLTAKPVIGVPTSVGYGVSFQGLSALLGMLNSCTPGVAVVNIDNGFGAACLAGKL